jgi:hypothetical protein
MSTIKADNLTGKTAAGSVTITAGTATMALQEGVSKMWANVDGSVATASLVDSNNVSSVSDIGTGAYNCNLSNNWNSTDSVAGTGSGHSGRIQGVYVTATTTARYDLRNSSNTAIDANRCYFACFGDLA